MKKLIILVLLLTLLGLVGCGECEHQWQQPSCAAPKTCSLCGATEGQPLEHIWNAATCEEAKRCTVCGATEGTALGHQWVDASCTQPKTCAACQKTEGEALGHRLLDANYQQSATCIICGHTQGDPLSAAYENYAVKVIEAQLGVEYDYVASCYIKGRTTVGKLRWEDYQVFTSDETHEAVEGYEWHSVTVKIVFSDSNAQKYGFIVQSALDDFYWVESKNGNGYTDSFTVSYNGVLYDQCLMANGYGSVSDWVDNTCTYTATFAWRVPVDYDGHMILFYDANIDLGDALEKGDDTLLAFRFSE